MTYAKEIKEAIFSQDMSKTIRAVLYARASTKLRSQQDTCHNQILMAEKFISCHPNITIVGKYVDDGVSGKNFDNRAQYNQMLTAIEHGKCDVVITKSSSRLNRDKFGTSYFEEICKKNHVALITLEGQEGSARIHDFFDEGEQLLDAFTSISDASFSRHQSMKGHDTQQLRIDNKILSAKDIVFGYDYHKSDVKNQPGLITINKECADIVLKIYKEYVYMSKTPAEILRSLHDDLLMITDKTSMRLMPKSEHSIRFILQDTRYIGKFYINKKTSEFGSGLSHTVRRNVDKSDWVLIERPDLRIIDDDLYDLAQRIHDQRVHKYDRPDKESTQSYFQGKHLFAGIVFCKECNRPYQFRYSDRNKTIGTYSVLKHQDCCNHHNKILENELEEIIMQALRRIYEVQDDLYNRFINILKDLVSASSDNSSELKSLEKKKASLSKEETNLIRVLASGGFSDESLSVIKAKLNDIEKTSKEISERISSLNNSKLDDTFINEQISSIKASVADLMKFTKIDRARVLNYVDRILIDRDGNIDIILKTGQTISAKISENYSQADDTTDSIFLTSFTYKRTVKGPGHLQHIEEVTINCYLRNNN